jgi:hypothetical protein
MIDIEFKTKEEISKQDVLKLMEEINLSSNSKTKLKGIIGGTDIGHHQWHQIYDALRFYKEYKFPSKWFNVLLIRGNSDKNFQLTFKNLLSSWLDILLEINLNRFKDNWSNELQKRKNISDDMAKNKFSNFI